MPAGVFREEMTDDGAADGERDTGVGSKKRWCEDRRIFLTLIRLKWNEGGDQKEEASKAWRGRRLPKKVLGKRLA